MSDTIPADLGDPEAVVYEWGAMYRDSPGGLLGVSAERARELAKRDPNLRVMRRTVGPWMPVTDDKDEKP